MSREKKTERLRIALSTYQDGSGQMTIPGSSRTLPGWRDFERCVAAVSHGAIAPEDKGIFDVLVPHDGGVFGISCKMKRGLDDVRRRGIVAVEASDAKSAFWKTIEAEGIPVDNVRDHPAAVGACVLKVLERCYLRVSDEVDLWGSCYLVLSWNKQGEYQLHQFDIRIPEASEIDWYYPEGKKMLRGDYNGKVFVQWYPTGGQLKLFFHEEMAVWTSEVFTLEPLPDGDYGLMSKTKSYFPEYAGIWNEEN